MSKLPARVWGKQDDILPPQRQYRFQSIQETPIIEGWGQVPIEIYHPYHIAINGMLTYCDISKRSAERGCVEDQPQQLQNPEALKKSKPVSIIRNSTANPILDI